MTLTVGSPCPDFTMPSRHGEAACSFYDWMAGRWALVFAFKPLSPTCSTELALLEALTPAFTACRAVMLGVAMEPDETVAGWLDDLAGSIGCFPDFPVIGDPSQSLTGPLGLLDPHALQPSLLRTAMIIDPDKRVATSITGSVTNGRNFTEMLRTLQALQLTRTNRVATPADWMPGAPVMLPPSLSQTDAESLYPDRVRVLHPYLRFVSLP